MYFNNSDSPIGNINLVGVTNNPRYQLTDRIKALQETNYLAASTGRALLNALNSKQLSRDAVHELILGLESSIATERRPYRGVNLDYSEATDRINTALEFASLNPWETSQAIVQGGGVSALLANETPGQRFNRLARRENGNGLWTYSELRAADVEVFAPNKFQQNFVDSEGRITLTTASTFTNEERQSYSLLTSDPGVQFLVNKFNTLNSNYKVNIVIGQNPVSADGRPESLGLNTAFYDPSDGILKGYILFDPSAVTDPVVALNELSEVLISAIAYERGSETSITAHKSLQILSAAIDNLAIDSSREQIEPQEMYEILMESVRAYSEVEVYKRLPEYSSLGEAQLAADLLMEVKFPYAELQNTGIKVEPKQQENGSYILAFVQEPSVSPPVRPPQSPEVIAEVPQEQTQENTITNSESLNGIQSVYNPEQGAWIFTQYTQTEPGMRKLKVSLTGSSLNLNNTQTKAALENALSQNITNADFENVYNLSNASIYKYGGEIQIDSFQTPSLNKTILVAGKPVQIKLEPAANT